MRCFDHFAEIISRIWLYNTNVNLTIVGKEKPVYRPLRADAPTLLSKAKSTFRNLNVSDRVSIIERLNPLDYRNLLVNSDVHFYFSRPFVASWSLLEAMSSGAAIVSNPTPMTLEILDSEFHGSPALLTDCLKHPESIENILDLLGDSVKLQEISSSARHRAEMFDFRSQSAKILSFVGIPG